MRMRMSIVMTLRMTSVSDRRTPADQVNACGVRPLWTLTSTPPPTVGLILGDR